MIIQLSDEQLRDTARVGRLETSAEPNRIHVSEDFAKAVSDEFRLEPRGTMQLKGKGENEDVLLDGGLTPQVRAFRAANGWG